MIHSKAVELPKRGKLWTFLEFVSAGGRPQITDWYSNLPPDVRAVFDDRLGFLAIHERKDWQLPEFRMLRGKEGRERISEIRWAVGGVQWRVLGFFGLAQMQYTILLGCTHKQGNYDPRDATDTAIRRKKSIERGERITAVYDSP